MADAKTRIRVTHKVYGWLGDLAEIALSGAWHRVKWDNGSETTEHIDDLNIRSEAKG